MVANILVLPLEKADRSWAIDLWQRNWNGDIVVSRGKIHHLKKLNGFVAKVDDERVGLVTYEIANNQYEIVSLDSMMEGVGIGSILIDQCIQDAKKHHCKRVWLVTTNDNTEALRFYQRRGFVINAVYKDAIQESRKLKPKIPHVGNNGIPIRDEIELEFTFEKIEE